MVQGFFHAICQVGIFMICAQAIIHFRPDGSYEKYLKMLVSAMILIQIFLPIAELFAGDSQISLGERMQQFQVQMEEGMEKARKSAEESEAVLSRMTLEEVRRQLATSEKALKGQETETGQEADGETAAVGEAMEEAEESHVVIEKIQVKIGEQP